MSLQTVECGRQMYFIKKNTIFFHFFPNYFFSFFISKHLQFFIAITLCIAHFIRLSCGKVSMEHATVVYKEKQMHISCLDNHGAIQSLIIIIIFIFD